MHQRPVVLHALLFGAAAHLAVLRSPRPSLEDPVRLHHKFQTIQLLHEELKTPEKTPLDEVLLAMLCLAANELETVASLLKMKSRLPFNSPLRSFQWLDVYGSVSLIFGLIRWPCDRCRRGGVESTRSK